MADRTTGRPRLLTPAFLFIAFSSLAYFTADGLLIPAVPLLVAGPLGGDDVAVGIAAGVFPVSALLLRPFTGRLGDRRGRRLLMLTGASLFALSVAAYAFARSVAWLIPMRMLTGAGEAFFFVGAAAAISDLAPPERRAEALSFFSLSLYTGIGIGPLIGEALIEGGRGFTATWLTGAAIALLAVALAVPVPETRPEVDASVRTRRYVVHPAGLLPGSALFASVLGMSGFFAFTALYARRDLGLSDSRAVFLLFSAVVILVRALGARIPDRIGVRRAALGALGLDALGLTILAVWTSPLGLYAGVVVFAFGVSLAFPALMAMAISGAPEAERASAVGTVTAFVDLAFTGPLILGVVADAWGYPGAFAAGAAIAAVGFLLLFSPAAVRRTAR
ncbi:MAG TPA: MFS transporter [Actinomycetota bacterium]|nr:MFS transporter [Actinomycetota bacterium]